MRDLIHFATYHDFGDPPIPARPKRAPRLEGTYYRGNDERHDELQDGGHYLTSTFHVSLHVAGEERRLRDGDEVGGCELEVWLEIERAPNTPDYFFDRRQMERIFGTASALPFLGRDGPVPDRKDLQELEAMQRWRLTFPVGRVDPEGERVMAGLVYVAEEQRLRERVIGARFHYGLQYQIETTDGVIRPTSDLWMGALYRTRKVRQSRIPLQEWFSTEPIPALRAPGPKDPVLQGIDEHEAKFNQ